MSLSIKSQELFSNLSDADLANINGGTYFKNSDADRANINSDQTLSLTVMTIWSEFARY